MSLRCKLLCLLVVTFTACEDTSSRPRTRTAAVASQPAHEHVDEAMEFLENLDQFREQEAQVKTAYHLNRWLESQKLSSDWQPDDMVNRLPRAVRDQGVAKDLTKRLFSVDDVLAIQEAVWMRQLSQWVAQQPLPPYFERWLASREPQLGADNAEQLGIAYRLFDWTIRNIQLDELLPSPDEAAVAPAVGTESQQNEPAIPAALRAVPGPGYQFEAWQVLVYGHGDAWQRMRVFTLLARQQGIDVVTLAFPGRTIPPRPRPWVSAVLLGDQLYLFDAKLGLPIPSDGFEGVATLQEVLDNPSVLQSLEIDDKHLYRLASEDLAEISALLDISAPNLSQRVQALESYLTGEHRTILTVPLTALSNRLRACRGLFDVYVWSIPFEASWYRAAYEQKMRASEQALAQHMFQFGMFENHSPLARARYLYFRGEIENREEQQGAKAILLNARINQSQLDEMATNEQVQRQLGLQRTGRESEAMWQAQLAGVKNMMIASKQQASFWLGLFQLEAGRFDSAIEWLRGRTLEPWPDSKLAPAARYNLSRAYEAQGDLATAQELLLAEKNALHEHGNYLRARILQKEIEEGRGSRVESRGPD